MPASEVFGLKINRLAFNYMHMHIHVCVRRSNNGLFSYLIFFYYFPKYI
jgi:hypothetical protein